MAPAVDFKIAAAEQRVRSLVVRIESVALASETRSQSERSAVLQTVEELRAEVRELASVAAAPQDQAAALSIIERIERAHPALETLFVPPIDLATPVAGPFMAWSSCSAADFVRPEFRTICAEMGIAPRFHRKIWEWAFIIHHLRRLEMLQGGKRGLVFGVGIEPLPALFAHLGANVTATDAPEGVGLGWSKDGQFAAKLDDLHVPSIVDLETFRRHVSYATCDMNAIGDEFTGYDFCWSSCCFEHLGDLEAGLAFVVNSVEKTLKPGGIACHTTEFNLSSNDATIEAGETVIYRRRDMERLVQLLRDRGHHVEPFNIAPDQHPFDFYVDVPPYVQNPHLRLKLFGYTSTSVGLVIRRGPLIASPGPTA